MLTQHNTQIWSIKTQQVWARQTLISWKERQSLKVCCKLKIMLFFLDLFNSLCRKRKAGDKQDHFSVGDVKESGGNSDDRPSERHFNGTHQTQWWSRRSTQTPQIRQCPALGGRATLHTGHQFLRLLSLNAIPSCSDDPARLASVIVTSCRPPCGARSLSGKEL